MQNLKFFQNIDFQHFYYVILVFLAENYNIYVASVTSKHQNQNHKSPKSSLHPTNACLLDTI